MSTESNCTPVDPRVQIELEKLNTATDNINKYEVELDEAKCEFKRILAESAVRIKQAAHKLGNSIDAARPYYESRIYAAQLTKETQQAAANYEKAKSVHSTAKEMVYLAEQGLGEKSTLDTACQEMLSHAASKVNQSQLEVTDARNSLKMCQLKLEVANNRVGKLQGQLKAAIKASRPYYETRANFNGALKTQKERISGLEGRVADAKTTYNEALKSLEQISEEIHRQRHQQRQLLLLNRETEVRDAVSRLSTTTTTTTTTTNTGPGHFTCSTIDSASSNNSEHHYHGSIPLDQQLSNSSKSATSCPVVSHHNENADDDSPHLLHDFDTVLTFPPQMHKSASVGATEDDLFAQAHLHGPYELRSSMTTADGGGGGSPSNMSSSTTGGGGGGGIDNDIEQWTEIRLSHSESTSSSYSNQSLLHDQTLLNGPTTTTNSGSGSGGGHGHGHRHRHGRHAGLLDDTQSHYSSASSSSSSSSSSDEPRHKVTCTIFQEEQQKQKQQGLSHWLSRSNSFKTAGRRQSLDLLIDAGDKVKDVFTFGFQKVGKTLERRSSESEMNADAGGGADVSSSGAPTTAMAGGGIGGSSAATTTTDFFFFSRSSGDPKELSDEQVENLLLHNADEYGAVIVESTLKSPIVGSKTTTTGITATSKKNLTSTTTTSTASHMSQLATLLF